MNLSYIGRITLVAALYFGAARLGLLLPFSGEIPTLLWPSTAISVVILLIYGINLWPGATLGAIFVALSNNHSIPLLIGVVIAHTGEIVLAAWLLKRNRSFDFHFAKFDDIRQFIVAAVVVGPLVGACLGMVAFSLSPEGASRHLINLWWEWWAGHAMSSIIIIPPILTIYNNRTLNWSRRQYAELLFLFAIILLVSILIFVRLPSATPNLPLGHAVFPFLLWLALRFTPRELTVASLLVSLLALYGTVVGSGPFSRTRPEIDLILLLTFVLSVVGTALIISTIMMQRRAAELNLAKRNDELEDRVAARAGALLISNTHLEQARDQAVAALVLKNQILANVSHDARTPLNVIILYAEMLSANAYGPTTTMQQERIKSILSSANELLRFINNMLDEAQLKSQTLAPTNGTINLAAWLEERARILRPLAEEKNLMLHIKLDPEMPEKIVGDAVWLSQIFNNLVDNAIKFTHSGAVSVIISANIKRSSWQLQVIDSGIGLSMAHREHVFDPFWQVDGSRTRTEHRGVGLGLSIVKQRVQLMGGSITVEGRPAGGSIFTINLPLEIPMETNND